MYDLRIHRIAKNIVVNQNFVVFFVLVQSRIGLWLKERLIKS